MGDLLSIRPTRASFTTLDESDSASFYTLYTKLSRGVMKPQLFGAVFDLCARYPDRRLMLDQEEDGKKFDLLIGYSDRSSYVGYRVVILDRADRLFVGEVDEKGGLRIQRTSVFTGEIWFLEIDAESFRSNMTPSQWEAFRSDPLARRLFDPFFVPELEEKTAAFLKQSLESDDPSRVSHLKHPMEERVVSVRLGGSYFQGAPWDADRYLGLHAQIDVTEQERLFPFGEGWSFGYSQLLAPEGRRLHEVSWLTRYIGWAGHIEVYLGLGGSMTAPDEEKERYGVMARGGLYLSSGDYFPERSWKSYVPDLVVDPIGLSVGAVFDEGDLKRDIEWRPTAALRLNFN